jgi:hypothetical protein
MQVAASLALLFIRALGVRTLQEGSSLLPPGADMTLMAGFDVSASHPGQRDSRPFVDAVLDRLDGVPTIAAAGFADFGRSNGAVRYWRQADAEGIRRVTAGGLVTRGWLEAIGATPVAGRSLDASRTVLREAVVNDALASRLTGNGQPALGQLIRVAHPVSGHPETVEIVGIVADHLVHWDGRPISAIYLPMPPIAPPAITLAVRATHLPSARSAIKEAVASADPVLPWISLETLEVLERRPMKPVEDLAWFAAVLGGVAMLLAATGLHALLAYTIRRRTHEFGIRMAIGAERTAIMWLVLRQGLSLVSIGGIAGLAAAVPLAFLMRGMFFAISPVDPLAMLAPLLLLLLVGLLAATVPAYRAVTVDPVEVLREA